MKINIKLEDGEDRPSFDASVEGVDPDQKSLAYSIYVLVRMLVELLNTPHRADLVSLIATLHKAHNEGATAEVSYGDTTPRTCH